MDQWLVYHESKQRKMVTLVMSKLSPVERMKLLPENDGEPNWQRLPSYIPQEMRGKCLQSQEELNKARVIHAAYKAYETHLSPELRLGVLLVRAHLLSSTKEGYVTTSNLCSDVSEIHPTLVADIQTALQAKERREKHHTDIINGLRERLAYHEKCFDAELDSFAKFVTLHMNEMYKYFSAASPTGLKPWQDVHAILLSQEGGGVKQPPNAGTLLERYRELQLIRTLCRGLPKQTS